MRTTRVRPEEGFGDAWTICYGISVQGDADLRGWRIPEEPVETGRLFIRGVDGYGRIPVRISRYSIAIRLIGKRVARRAACLSSGGLQPERVGGRHERLIAKRPSAWTWITWKS